jgi:hypothetical protein
MTQTKRQEDEENPKNEKTQTLAHLEAASSFFLSLIEIELLLQALFECCKLKSKERKRYNMKDTSPHKSYEIGVFVNIFSK